MLANYDRGNTILSISFTYGIDLRTHFHSVMAPLRQRIRSLEYCCRSLLLYSEKILHRVLCLKILIMINIYCLLSILTG